LIRQNSKYGVFFSVKKSQKIAIALLMETAVEPWRAAYTRRVIKTILLYDGNDSFVIAEGHS
jgi:hypothetical protein